MELLKISSLLPFELGRKRPAPAYKDNYQLKNLRQYAQAGCYKKLFKGFCNHLINFDEVTFKSLFDKASVKSIKKKYGKSLYEVNHNYDHHQIKILYFKRIISNEKVKLEFHFCDDELFYYSYTFPYLPKNDKDYIINNLCNKYNVNSNVLLEYCMLDRQQIALNIKDYLDLSIKYLDTKSIFYDYIQKQPDHKVYKSNISKNISNLTNLF